MKHAISLLLLLPFLIPSYAQDEDELLFRIEEEHESFRSDELGHIYLIGDVEIRMWNGEGKHQFRYSNNSLGRISDVDLTRALKPLVFYSSMSTLVILDNTLSVQGNPVNLGDHGLDQAELVCNSVNAHYWFFDGARNALVRTDKSFREVDRSGNLARLMGIRLNPTQMVEFREYLYLNDPAHGIFVFDIFGSHIRTIPVKGAQSFQISSERIHYMQDGEFRYYDRTTHESGTIELPEKKGVRNVRIGKERLFLSKEGELAVYRSSRKKIPRKEKQLDPEGDR